MSKIGYAVVNESLKPDGYKSCRIKSPYDEGIDFVVNRAYHNLDHLKHVLKWNLDHGILFYRLSNSLIPLATHRDFLRDFKWRWHSDEKVMEGFKEIKEFVVSSGMRLSIHPDPYVVLNSLKEEVANRAIEELDYLAQVLSLCGGTDLVVYIGGQYGNSKEAMRRFCNNFEKLNKRTKNMIRIKNDDSHFTLTECLDVSIKIGVPLVFDYHHYKCNHTKWEDLSELINQVYHTWDEVEDPMIVALTSGKTAPFDKDHGDYVDEMDYLFLESLMTHKRYDLMVEAKKRELAVFKLRET